MPGPDGDRLTLRYADVDFFAGWLVGYGADVVVLDPPELREEVVKRLKAIVAGATGAVTSRRRSAGRVAGVTNSVDRLGPAAQPGAVPAGPARDHARRGGRRTTTSPSASSATTSSCCGCAALPGYGPGDLIDMAFIGDGVTVTYDAGIDRPLRLTPTRRSR